MLLAKFWHKSITSSCFVGLAIYLENTFRCWFWSLNCDFVVIVVGFKFGDRACCGGGRFNGRDLCLPIIQPCPDRSDYVFWDAFHPTEACNILLFNQLSQQFE